MNRMLFAVLALAGALFVSSPHAAFAQGPPPPVELECHGCVNVGQNQFCDANGGTTGKKDLCVMTWYYEDPERWWEGYWLCSYEGDGEDCDQGDCKEVEADLSVTVTGTYPPTPTILRPDENSGRHLGYGLIVVPPDHPRPSRGIRSS